MASAEAKSAANGWQNPYDAPNTTNSTRSKIAQENWAKVQKRKAEARFLKDLPKDFKLSTLERIKQEVATEDRHVESRAAPKRQLLASQPDKEGFRTIQRFEGDIRCLEVTQGGATIWTAANDGSITVRSGGNGVAVHTIPASGTATIDIMYSTDTHMWCGLSDGTVRVYDHLVFLHITEGKFHTGAVTAFAPTFDGRMFSAGEDGSVVKWDCEEKNFEAMVKFVSGHSKGITSAAAFGYTLFTGAQDGSIRSMDIDSGSPIAVFEGHKDKILGLVVCDGTLFSASEDSTVRAWIVESAACIKAWSTQSPVVSLSVDSKSHRLWAGQRSGVIDVWRTLAEDNFTLERTIEEHQGKSLVAVKNFCAIDSLKIWSFASNGVNKVWYSSVNKLEEAMVGIIAALKAVIAQDTIELDKWRALVARLQMIDNRRKIQLARTLEAFFLDLLRRRYQWNWKQFVQLLHARRRKIAISKRLAYEADISLLRTHFTKYFRWYRAAQNLRLKTKYSDMLRITSQKSIVQLAFRRMQIFTRRMKETMKRRDLVSILGRNNNQFLLRKSFRKWLKYRHNKKFEQRRLRYSDALARTTSTGLSRVYFVKWLTIAQRVTIRKRREKFGEFILHLTSHGIRQHTFKLWFKYMRYRQDLARKKKLAESLLTTTERGLQSIYWSKFVLLRAKAQKRNLDAQRVEAEKVACRHERKVRCFVRNSRKEEAVGCAARQDPTGKCRPPRAPVEAPAAPKRKERIADERRQEGRGRGAAAPVHGRAGGGSHVPPQGEGPELLL